MAGTEPPEESESRYNGAARRVIKSLDLNPSERGLTYSVGILTRLVKRCVVLGSRIVTANS